MNDFNKLISRFRQFGGMTLVWQYAKMGVLWTGLYEFIKCCFSRRSFKTIYPAITAKVDNRLVRQLIPYLKEQTDCSDNGLTSQSNCVWFCWLQGIDKAPEMVKVCLESQRRLFGDKVVVIDDNNYSEWIELPQFIIYKYRNGIIPPALFSDLIRLELLINHGGTWIDSTVLADPTHLATNPQGNLKWRPTIDEIINSELYIFRYFHKGKITGLSNWFIHSKPHNPLLVDIRDMLHAYWRMYNCTVEYYIFHILFSVAARRYPRMINNMPKGNSFHSVMLNDKLSSPFDETWWDELTQHVCFHKLNYRLEQQAKEVTDSFWNKILNLNE